MKRDSGVTLRLIETHTKFVEAAGAVNFTTLNLLIAIRMRTTDNQTNQQSNLNQDDPITADEASRSEQHLTSQSPLDNVLGKLWPNSRKKTLIGNGVSREDVVWCYRTLLDREPESEEVIKAHRRTINFKELVAGFVDSQEFRAKCSGITLGGSGSGPILPPLLERLHIEVDASPTKLGRCAAKIKTTWEHLGHEKAHFSVVTDESFLPENLSGSIDSFWALGTSEAEVAARTLRQYGMRKLEEKVCVEYGCGVGRVTVNFATSFQRVHAYDISRNHLHHARARANELGLKNIEFHECANDFRVAIEPCDFFYSVIVLQHNPPPVIMELIRIALAALKPEGIAIFQVPTYIIGYRFDLDKWLATDHVLDMQMHCVPQDAVLDAISETGCRLLGLREDGWTSAPDKMISNTFMCQKQG